MQLIGMLDSPYVRRVAISLQFMQLPFEHRSLSVFRTFEQFRAINPVVKAPTLVCDDGQLLMDSTLILEYAQGLAKPSLMPTGNAERLRALRIIGLALVACEKGVQIIYEKSLRPAEKQHEPWIARISGQLLAAFGALEAELKNRRPQNHGVIDQAGITSAVAWRFTQMTTLSATVDPALHPALSEWSAQAEALPEFKAAPHGDATYVAKAA